RLFLAPRNRDSFFWLCAGGQTQRQRNPPVSRIRQTANPKASRIAFYLIEEQHRRLRHQFRGRFHQRADLTVPIGSFDQPIIADFFRLFDETPKISVCEFVHRDLQCSSFWFLVSSLISRFSQPET